MSNEVTATNKDGVKLTFKKNPRTGSFNYAKPDGKGGWVHPDDLTLEDRINSTVTASWLWIRIAGLFFVITMFGVGIIYTFGK